LQKQIRVGLFVFLLLTTINTRIAVHAQEGQPTDDEVNAIAKKMYCPVCENTPLDVCGTQACIDWREEIRLKLAEGWSEERVIQYFVEQHGAQILPEPPAEGFNLLVYILPPIIFLVGFWVLVQTLRNWRRPEQVISAVAQEEQDVYLNRMEEQLRKRQEDT